MFHQLSRCERRVTQCGEGDFLLPVTLCAFGEPAKVLTSVTFSLSQYLKGKKKKKNKNREIQIISS